MRVTFQFPVVTVPFCYVNTTLEYHAIILRIVSWVWIVVSHFQSNTDWRFPRTEHWG